MSAERAQKKPGRLDPTVRDSLRELQTGDNQSGEDVYGELVDAFLRTSESFIVRLRETPEDYREIAHSWKSSARGIGAMDLGALCASLEKTEAGNTQVQKELIAQIVDEYRAVCATLGRSLLRNVSRD